ncbi:MAG TPA: class III lanthionine synthetase LanKC [Candidatus Angelobacter sp.]|nr:class III lanthionine synthetase LanKC [Candidatus Angelobacter sp.]
MRSRPTLLYELLDRDYYETFDAYVPEKADFYHAVDSRLPAGWEIQRQNVWFQCGSPDNVVPQQGWKIHVSATCKDARGTLERVVTVLFRRKDTAFKFALDRVSLALLNSKGWTRGGAGKFITIYPKDIQCFLELLEELHSVTRGQAGPYILSDYRYGADGVVFYRYGGMRARYSLNVRGELVPVLLAPDGTETPDRRLPFPVTPPWADVPFPAVSGEDTQSGELMLLQNGRYEIQNVMAFSNAGGVYRAIDRHTGLHVVLKEARPHVGPANCGIDAIELLKKEHRLLTILSDSGIAPRPNDLFQEWEHWFLVEEFIEGVTLANHSLQHNILLRTRPCSDDLQQWLTTFSSVALNLIKTIEILHDHGIVFGDLSPNNLIVKPGTNDLCVIDFEAAQQIGIDAPLVLYTPGFASKQRMSSGAATFAEDYYALGAVLSSYLLPLNGLFQFRPEAKTDVLRSIAIDLHLPANIVDAILRLLSSEPAERPTPKMLTQLFTTPCEPMNVPSNAARIDYGALIGDIEGHILNSATYKRHDRLFPADASLFATNPLSLSHGAAGVAYALHRISDQFPERAVDWILQHKITNNAYPPGLYIGSSGIAWCLLELGLQKEAEKIFQLTLSSPLRYKAADLFYGMAGNGLTALRFFMDTQNESYLDCAIGAGEELLRTGCRSGNGLYWPDGSEIRLGMAHGASGIALFLLYLFMITEDARFLAAGQGALNFDLSFARETRDEGLSWAHSDHVASPLYPYWRFGSAGVGAVVLRYYRLLRDPQYRSLLEQIFIEVDRKYAVLTGQFMGLSGLGEFSLDLYEYFGEERFLNSARKAAEGIMLFRVDRAGIAFPGDQLLRLSCDYGTGSAGVALFLNRLAGRQGNNFMLDSLFHLPAGLPENTLSPSQQHSIALYDVMHHQYIHSGW